MCCPQVCCTHLHNPRSAWMLTMTVVPQCVPAVLCLLSSACNVHSNVELPLGSELIIFSPSATQDFRRCSHSCMRVTPETVPASGKLTTTPMEGETLTCQAHIKCNMASFGVLPTWRCSEHNFTALIRLAAWRALCIQQSSGSYSRQPRGAPSSRCEPMWALQSCVSLCRLG